MYQFSPFDLDLMLSLKRIQIEKKDKQERRYRKSILKRYKNCRLLKCIISNIKF